MGIRKYKTSIMQICVAIGVTAIFLWRMLHTINIGDEVQNLTMAYRIVLGQRPWVEIWEIFQSGNSFAAPFIWALVKLQGNSEGIVLWSRLAYFIMNVGLAVILTATLRKYLSGWILLAVDLLIICYAPFSLYYIWYDTAGLYFMVLGSLMLFCAQETGKKGMAAAFAAGIAHALMSYAYPSMVVLVVVYGYVIYRLLKSKNSTPKEIITKELLYFGAEGMVFLIFVLYMAVVKFPETIFGKADVLHLIFNSHDDGFSFIRKVVRLVKEPVRIMKYLLLPTAILLGINFWNKGKREPVTILLLASICALPVIFLFNGDTLATIYYLFYLYCWAPFLIPYTDKQKREVLVPLYWLMWVPSLFCYVLIGMTSNNGGLKSPLGAYAGSIFAVIVLGLVLEQVKRGCYKAFCLLCVIGELVLYYANTYFYGSAMESRYYFNEGVFRGLYGREEDRRYIDEEKLLESQVQDGDDSILCVGTELLGAYLYTDLKPATFFFSWRPYIETDQGNDWTPTEYYWSEITGPPDLIVVSEESSKDDFLSSLLEHAYQLSVREHGLEIYRKIR